ncbi:MAG TPA: sodium:proton antiporter [Burkholderiales bacterium]|nr:sodium:proton antiporter [Burkholderiales bacterium]
MTLFQTVAIVLCLSAFAAYINYRYLHLPTTIGLMVVSLSISLVIVGFAATGFIDLSGVDRFVKSINFYQLILNGLLAFFLFAGAMHVNLAELKLQKWPVAVMATIGVFSATIITGGLFWLLTYFLDLHVSLLHALLFGALISPTDPISVLGIMKRMKTPKSLEIVITAESLFNDGVGVVVFLTLLQIALSHTQPAYLDISVFMLGEAAGGVAMGYVLGMMVSFFLREVDDYQIEILMTLALAAGGYALAELIHVSAPIAIVVCGLVIGNRGQKRAVSALVLERLDIFWELVDDILNAVLFMLIGLEVIALSPDRIFLVLGFFAIAVVLIGRLASIVLSAGIIRPIRHFTKGEIAVMTWAGLRGGLSMAMALSIPDIPGKRIILTVTYVVVVFSVLVQGLSLSAVIRRALF